MRLGLFSLALVVLSGPAAWAAQPLTPQPMVVPATGMPVGYGYNIAPGAGCGHGSACGPQAYNAFSACGCNGCGRHAGGYGCCPKPACDGSIWTSTLYPRTNNLHLWDTYCAETAPCARRRRHHQQQCPLHSYHRQPQFTMPVSYASGGIQLDPAHIPHMEPAEAVTPNVPATQPPPEPANNHNAEDALPTPAPQPALEAPAAPPAPPAPPAAPMLSPDAVELTPAEEGPAGLDAPPAPPSDDEVELTAPRL